MYNIRSQFCVFSHCSHSRLKGTSKKMRKHIHAVLNEAYHTINRIDAEILLGFALKKSRSFILAHNEFLLTAEQYSVFRDYVTRAEKGEPIAYITQQREFWSLNLNVNEHTLIPRPETELMVEWVLEHFPQQTNIKIADLGTGSGAIALAIAKEKPEWQVIATDISENALLIARKNAQQLKLENISFYQGNWCTALPFTDFDLIVSNPPYIAEVEWETFAAGLAYEPRSALVAGYDGLDAIKIICKSARNHLKPKGYLIVEHGYLQGRAVREVFTLASFTNIATVQDILGHERITLGQC